ncbi:MAG: glycosyltransferase family 4 protein [Chloroflexaceae bacterium]|nr:glycosyltransferase family 4 protein [Chloroflexaceae bacterium]
MKGSKWCGCARPTGRTGELARALHQGPRPDLVHLLHPRNVLAAQVTAWAQKHRIPTVYTWLGPFHDAYLTPDRERPFEKPPTYERLVFTRRALVRQAVLEQRWREVLRNYRLHWPLAAATALLPCSEFEAEVMRRFGLTQPQAMVPLWIDTPFIQTVPVRPPALQSPRPWLLFVGQLTIRKGYDLVVQALPAIVAAWPAASLLVVSGINQQQRDALMRLATRMGVQEHITLLGYLSDEELINLYRASDVLLFPTRYEGFGLPLLEAMAAECPLVSTDIPVVREIVRDGENGILVPYGDVAALARAAMAVVGDEPLRQRLVRGGQATVRERYREDDLVGRVEELYGRVVRSSA